MGGLGVEIGWDLGNIWGFGVEIGWDLGENWGDLGSKLDGIWGEIWKMVQNGDLGLKNWLKFGVKMGKIHRILGILVNTS